MKLDPTPEQAEWLRRMTPPAPERPKKAEAPKPVPQQVLTDAEIAWLWPRFQKCRVQTYSFAHSFQKTALDKTSRSYSRGATLHANNRLRHIRASLPTSRRIRTNRQLLKHMTPEQQQLLIESAATLFRETLGESMQDINTACGVALEESQDNEKGTCKFRVPFALVLNLANHPPSFHVELAVASRRKFVSESAQLEDDTPKLPGME